MPPRFSIATHPASAIRALSGRNTRGSTPRKTVNPTARHATATMTPRMVVCPTVSQRSSEESRDRSGPGASVSLVVSMNGMPPSPVWGSAVKNAAPIHSASQAIRLQYRPRTPASAAAVASSRGQRARNRTAAARTYSSAAPG